MTFLICVTIIFVIFGFITLLLMMWNKEDI